MFVDEVLKEAGLSPKELEAVAVGIGPGSYTGLRIGLSAAKGFCYALDIPILGIGTLETLVQAVALKTGPAARCPAPPHDRRPPHGGVHGRLQAGRFAAGAGRRGGPGWHLAQPSTSNLQPPTSNLQHVVRRRRRQGLR